MSWALFKYFVSRSTGNHHDDEVASHPKWWCQRFMRKWRLFGRKTFTSFDFGTRFYHRKMLLFSWFHIDAKTKNDLRLHANEPTDEVLLPLLIHQTVSVHRVRKVFSWYTHFSSIKKYDGVNDAKRWNRHSTQYHQPQHLFGGRPLAQRDCDVCVSNIVASWHFVDVRPAKWTPIRIDSRRYFLLDEPRVGLRWRSLRSMPFTCLDDFHRWFRWVASGGVQSEGAAQIKYQNGAFESCPSAYAKLDRIDFDSRVNKSQGLARSSTISRLIQGSARSNCSIPHHGRQSARCVCFAFHLDYQIDSFKLRWCLARNLTLSMTPATADSVESNDEQK